MAQSKKDLVPLADSLRDLNVGSARLYRVSGFWSFRIVTEDGGTVLGTGYSIEEAIFAALSAKQPNRFPLTGASSR